MAEKHGYSLDRYASKEKLNRECIAETVSVAVWNKRELVRGRPILLTFNPGLAVGHAVVVTGASTLNGEITSVIYRDPAPNETNSGHRGRVELSGDELACFLPSVRSHWLVSARQL
jgi:Papain-like cysteine protease AvrRpt2